MKKDERGIAFVGELFLILIVIGLIAGAGYFVMKSRTKKTATSPATTTTVKEPAKKLIWKEGGMAVAGTYADADVVKVNDTTWRMYYAIQPEAANGNLAVYSSSSTDGKTWTRDAGTRKNMATFPNVVKLTDGRYRMYFQNAAVIKSAISSDGLTFNDESGVRVDKTNSLGLAFDNVAAPTVLAMKDGTFVMVYRCSVNQRFASNTPNPSTQLLLWATSSDGITFTQKGLAVDSRNETLNGQLDGPNLVAWDDNTYKLFATTYTGVYEMSFDGKGTFGSPALALAGEAKKDNMGFHGSPPGDPSVVKINGIWYMYFGGPRESNGIHYATYQ